MQRKRKSDCLWRTQWMEKMPEEPNSMHTEIALHRNTHKTLFWQTFDCFYFAFVAGKCIFHESQWSNCQFASFHNFLVNFRLRIALKINHWMKITFWILFFSCSDRVRMHEHQTNKTISFQPTEKERQSESQQFWWKRIDISLDITHMFELNAIPFISLSLLKR